jgi:hypothetical protein
MQTLKFSILIATVRNTRTSLRVTVGIVAIKVIEPATATIHK